MSSFVPRAQSFVHISLCSERAFGRMHHGRTSPRRVARGKGAGSHGLPGQGQGTRTGARFTRAESHTRRHRTDPGCVEVVGLAVGPGRSLHSLTAAIWVATAASATPRAETS